MNAAEPKLCFSREEFRARLEKSWASMQRHGLDLLIVSDPANMAWITGYDGWSFYVHQCVLVPLGEEPIWFGRMQDVQGAYRRTYLPHDRVVGYQDHYVQSIDRHPMDCLAAVIGERGYAKGAIGMEFDNYFCSAAAHLSLEKHLPNAIITDATYLVNWLRVVKSPAEIGYMRSAARIIEGVFERVRTVMKPGMRQCDLVAEIYDAAIRGKGEHWGDYTAIVPLIGAGPEAAAPHLTWTDEALRANEGIFLELAGAHRRYHCPMSRTFYIGKPDQKFRDTEKAVREGLEAGLEKAKPGNTCEDIAVAFYTAIEHRGLKKESRTGYSIGLSYPPDWGEHTMSLRRGDHTELRPGMAIHFMPGLHFGDWGFQITESILITPNGHECLANVPREILVID
ncbi:MAG: M24 family metallopeptidase [Dongiaceae bacterium]